MGNPAVFSVAAQCFAGMDEAGYVELTAPEVWEGFVEGLGASSGLAHRTAVRAPVGSAL